MLYVVELARVCLDISRTADVAATAHGAVMSQMFRVEPVTTATRVGVCCVHVVGGACACTHDGGGEKIWRHAWSRLPYSIGCLAPIPVVVVEYYCFLIIIIVVVLETHRFPKVVYFLRNNHHFHIEKSKPSLFPRKTITR